LVIQKELSKREQESNRIIKEINDRKNTINNIKYYLEEIKKNVKDSVLMVHDESYGHVAEDFISLLEPLSSNPMSCFNSDNLAKIEKESMNILSAAYDAGLREKIPAFPLVESYFYNFLYLCRRKVEIID
jgi:archaellum component FlaC